MTRVTQSMLSSNMLRNLNTSYGKMSKMQDNLTSGMKITRASDDPVVAVKGMQYRTQLDKVQQFQRNINEAEAWLDTTDIALDQVGSALNRVKELVVQAANDTNTADDRAKIKVEIDQIKAQIQDVANTQLGGKYIFSGTKTQTAPYVNGELNPALYETDVAGNILDATDTNGTKLYDPTDLNAFPKAKASTTGEVKIEVFDGVQLTVNTSDANEVFKTVDNVLGKISEALGRTTSTGEEISDLLGGLANGTNPTLSNAHVKVLDVRADVGARMNRVELMMNRLDIQEINVTKQKSNNEDTDYAETITHMVTQESIHQAALSVGAKIIQQTLVDFIR